MRVPAKLHSTLSRPFWQRAEDASANAVVWGLSLLLVVTVLATKAVAPEFPGDETRFFRVMQTAPDLFNAIKAAVFTWGIGAHSALTCVWLALAWVRLRKSGQPIWRTFLAPLASRSTFALVAALLTLTTIAVASTLTSKHPGLARLGFWDHFEGRAVFACYFALAILSVLCARFRSSGFRAAVTASACAASALVAAVGAFQYSGNSVWEWPIFRSFVVVPHSDVRIWSTWGEGTFSATLYNPNWAGLFYSIVSPLAVFLAATRPRCSENTSGTRGAVRTAVLCAWVGICGAALSASGSRSAFVATSASLAIFTLLVCATRTGRASFSLPRLGAALAIFGLCIVNVRSHRGASVATDLMTQVGTVDTIARVERLETRGDALVASWHGTGLSLMLQGAGNLVLRNEHGIVIPWREEEGVLHALHPELLDFAVQRMEGKGDSFALRFDDARVAVAFLPVGARVFHSGAWMRAETPEEPSFLSWIPEGLANGRGYNWKRGIALAIDHAWLGVGPGAWADVFPQNDFAGKLRTFGKTDVTIEKPHSFYLGLAGTFGIPFLLLFLCVGVTAFVRAFRTWRATRSAWPLALCASLLSFSVAGIFNDSSIGVTPFFLVVLGCALTPAPRPPAARFHPSRP